MTPYAEFLASKRIAVGTNGPTVEPGAIHPMLFPFQRDLVRWAVRKGRAALFADTGLGKTLMQVEWARPIWYGIRESATLNVAEAREEKDERHIAALQLETVRRCVMLWSNAGETVLDPFAGIGTTGYVAIQNGRRFLGCELKRSYYESAVRNISRAANVQTLGLFDVSA